MLSDDFTTGTVSLVVAVTGHRELGADDIPRYGAEIRLILGELKKKYPSTPLLLLSGLAEGADRIAVRVAREKEIAVPYVAILPMPEDLYRTEFTTEASDREFQDLLDNAARCITLPLAPGATRDAVQLPGDARSHQYRLLGEYLVRYSQILIAVWDQDRARKEGGTTDVVDLKLRRDMRHHRLARSRINAEGAGPVYIIPARTAGAGHAASPAGPARRRQQDAPHGAKWEEYEACYRLLDQFNADVARAGKNFAKAVSKSREDLFAEGEPEGLTPAMKWVVAVYSRADALAIRYSERGLLTWKFAFVMLACAGLCLALSHVPGLDDFLYGYYGCLAPPALLILLERKAELRGRHEDYRALAEALRVQFFWMVAGLPDLAADQYLRKQAGEMVWIRDAISECALHEGVLGLSPAEPEGRAARLRLAHDWVVSQKGYFERTGVRHERKKRGFHIFAGVAGMVGLALPLLGRFCELGSWAEVTAPVAMWWAALAVDYVERRGFTQEARQYAQMRVLFQDADQDLDEFEADREFGKCEETLRELGCQSLTESADWLALHRERRLSTALGAK
jgi:hypothetical protein